MVHLRWLPWVVCVLVLGLGVTGQALRTRSPRWYWALFGFPACWVRMMTTWKKLCLESALTTTRRGERAVIGGRIMRGQEVTPLVPRLWIGRPTRWGLDAQVRLLPGQVPALYQEAAEAMEHAWRVHGVRVTSPRKGFVRIQVTAVDPLAGPPARGRQLPRGGLPSITRTPLDIRVGDREDGQPWSIDLRLIPHWLIVGATRSGKSTLLHALLAGLVPLPVAVCAVDLKGGLELSVYDRRLTFLASTLKEAETLFTGLLGIIADRMAVCREHDVTSIDDVPGDYPHIVLVLDEVAELYLTGGDRESKALSESATTTLIRLAQLGAALGLHLVVAAQRLGSDLGNRVTTLRAQLPGRVCHHVNDAESAVMVFGDVNKDAVTAAQNISHLHKGYAITSTPEGGWIRVRSTFTTRDAAGALASQHADMYVGLPGVGSALSLEDA